MDFAAKYLKSRLARDLLWLRGVRNKRDKLVKTGLSGIAASMVDVVALVCLIEFAGLSIVLSAFVSAGLGAACGFVITKFWAFRDSRPIGLGQVAAYATVAGGNAILVSVSIHVLVIFGAAYLLAKLIASAGAFALWSYPAQSRWVFA